MRRTACCGLFCRRQRRRLTWRGWLVLAVVAGVFCWVVPPRLCSFLAVTDRVDGTFLVVESWMPDYAMEEVVEEFKAHRYERILTTGGPLEEGSYFSGYTNYPLLACATLESLGIKPEKLEAVPAPEVARNRTYASALALKAWFQEHQVPVKAFNVVTLGPHARRTRLLFQRAFGGEAKVGVMAIQDRTYDPPGWWKSVEGFEAVMSELVAYLYARVI
jgi:uncharacterized SAM-binding protein YcdF (DUF218 family)